MSAPVDTLVVPVYRNENAIDELVTAVGSISEAVPRRFEAVFVVDGSPDDSHAHLLDRLADAPFPSRIVEHARNFGSFAAIRTGMALARGEHIAVMAADLQEPPELIIEFLRRLDTQEVDIVAGERASRDDRGDLSSKLYWRLYRRFVVHDIPRDGVDVFACNSKVRDVVCSLEEVNTSLVAQLFWVGFRRELIPYDRRPRSGKSGWTFRRRVRYLSDSVFAFTDLPVRLLWIAGMLGLTLGATLAVAVIIGRLSGVIDVPGYSATVLVLIFFGSLNLVGLGIIGSYVWRAYETVKGRPGAIVRTITEYPQGGRNA